MNYEINVSRNGSHYFATADRSISDQSKAKRVVDHFRELFPETEGYKITVRRLSLVYQSMEL